MSPASLRGLRSVTSVKGSFYVSDFSGDNEGELNMLIGPQSAGGTSLLPQFLVHGLALEKGHIMEELTHCEDG